MSTWGVPGSTSAIDASLFYRAMELAERVVRPRLHGAQRDPQPGGDLRLGEVRLVGQLENLPVRRAQRVQRLTDAETQQQPVDGLVRLRAHLHLRMERARRGAAVEV